MTTFMDFPESLKNKIYHWISKYPSFQKKSAVLPVLLLVQENHQGYLTEELMQIVADHLEMPYIAVYEVASFYSMYELKPIGQYKIAVCTNISCLLAGCNKIVAHLKKVLKTDFNQTSEDGKFTLREVECLGACTSAPVMHIGHEYHENLTPEKVDKILESLA